MATMRLCRGTCHRGEALRYPQFLATTSVKAFRTVKPIGNSDFSSVLHDDDISILFVRHGIRIKLIAILLIIAKLLTKYRCIDAFKR